MAQAYIVTNPGTGAIKKTFIGYSWTMLFFNALAPLFRWDLKTFAALCAANILLYLLSPNMAFYSCVSSLPGFIYSFFWNRFYTQRLLAKGYEFASAPAANAYALARLRKPNLLGYAICIVWTCLTLAGAWNCLEISNDQFMQIMNI